MDLSDANNTPERMLTMKTTNATQTVAADMKQILCDVGTGKLKVYRHSIVNPLVKRAVDAECLVWHEESQQYALTALGQSIAFAK
jgi:hypothetical protein